MVKLMDEFARISERFKSGDGPDIRLMRPDDLDEVLRLIRLHDSDDYKAARASFAHTDFHAPPEHIAHAVLLDPQDQRPVAVSGYYVDDLEAQGVYWLGWTYVNPFFRGKGYGGAVMEWVLTALQHMGARKCFLSTSSLPKYQTAVGFYERYGFVTEGRLKDFYAPGEDQLIMGADLARVPRFKTRTWSTPKAPSYQPPPIDRSPKQEAPEEDDGEVVFEF